VTPYDKIIGEQALTETELADLVGMVMELVDTTGLSNRADGKTVVLSEAQREDLHRLVREIPAERKSRSEAWAAAGDRSSEILKLRSRVKQLEDAVRKAIDFGDGYAWWDSEGNAKIEAGGHKLLKETLENA